MLVAQAYSKRMESIGIDEEALDFSFLLDQTESVIQSTYNTFSRVLEGTTPNNKFVSVSTFGFMNKRVKNLSD
ncbi:hypothetical protein AE073_06495 [Listeria monocytogenes]|nr:hypothetical protein [Listeria monocytogenes]EAC8473803.1 hypothetical protein [Listeria monocytogenes]